MMFPSHNVRIGMVQFSGKLGCVEENLCQAKQMIAEAVSKGAQIVCLPELFVTGYNLSLLAERTIELGFLWHDKIIAEMAETAKACSVYLIAPMGRKTSIPGVLANSAMLFAPDGSCQGYFDKTHLWALEGLYYQAGKDYPTFTLNIGGDSVTIGLMICYDAGFPESCRSLALNGAQIVFCPAAWRVQDMDMWDLNLAQRALENLLFVVGVNRVGHEGDLHLFGKSKICNPRGHVVAEIPFDQEEVGVFEIDLGDVARFRAEIPYLRDRKPSLYGALVESRR